MSSAIQNAPQELPPMQATHYGTGMNAPLLSGQGPSPPQITTPEVPSPPPAAPVMQQQQEFTLPKMTNYSTSLGQSDGPVGFAL